MTLSQSATAAAAPGALADGPLAVRSMLRMAVADEILAVPIEEVREILQVGRMTPLPRTPGFVRGVMNLRGGVVPVIDLAERLGGAHTVIGRRSCIVIVECRSSPSADDAGDEAVASLVVGLLVDAVFEVFDCDAAAIEPVPSLGTRVPASALQGMARAHGSVIGVLALGRELAPRELAEAIAAFQPH